VGQIESILAETGRWTIRFTKGDVMSNIADVLDMISETLSALPDWRPGPEPSLEGEGEL